MSTTWLSLTFAAVMIATVVYHVSRLAATDAVHRELDVDVTHAAMGIGMAGMLIGRLTPGESYWWALGFAVPTAWFASRITWTFLGRGARFVGNHLRQLLTSAAMVFMLGAVAATAGTATVAAAAVSDISMPGMAMSGGSAGSSAVSMPHLGGSGVSSASRLLDVLLTLAIIGVATWTFVIVVRRLRLRGREGGPLTPALGASCQLAMNVTTVYMLVLML